MSFPACLAAFCLSFLAHSMLFANNLNLNGNEVPTSQTLTVSRSISATLKPSPMWIYRSKNRNTFRLHAMGV